MLLARLGKSLLSAASHATCGSPSPSRIRGQFPESNRNASTSQAPAGQSITGVFRRSAECRQPDRPSRDCLHPIDGHQPQAPDELRVEDYDHDGESVFTIEAKFTVGRPLTLSPGAGQHTPIALNNGVAFPGAGATASSLGSARAVTSGPRFRVHDQMAQQAPSS